MSWSELFDRATAYDASESAIREALADRRAEGASRFEQPADVGDGDAPDPDYVPGLDTDPDSAPEPSPSRVVADADVLAADLLAGGNARDALDEIRSHSWMRLVASDALLADAEAVVAELATPDLAGEWRAEVESLREQTAHPPGDHPAIASAYHGGAMHVLSLDPELTSARAGAGIRSRVPVSVREPRAFAAVFSPASLYESAVGGSYPGPDRDPRA